MKIQIAFLTTILILFGMPVGLRAQGGDENEGGSGIRIAVAQYASGKRNAWVRADKDGWQEITLDRYRILGPFARPSGNRYDILGEAPVAGDSEKKTALLASCELPAARNVLVVLLPSAPAASGEPVLPYQAQVVLETDFVAGSVVFFNPTERAIGVKVDDSSLKIAPGGRDVLRPQFGAGDASKSVQIAYHEEKDWNLFSSTRWVLRRDSRHLVFFFVNPRTKKMDYSSLTDYMDLAAPP